MKNEILREHNTVILQRNPRPTSNYQHPIHDETFSSNPHLNTLPCPPPRIYLPTYNQYIAYHVITRVATAPQIDTGTTLTNKVLQTSNLKLQFILCIMPMHILTMISWAMQQICTHGLSKLHWWFIWSLIFAVYHEKHEKPSRPISVHLQQQ